jgi:hypothetical protein
MSLLWDIARRGIRITNGTGQRIREVASFSRRGGLHGTVAVAGLSLILEELRSGACKMRYFWYISANKVDQLLISEKSALERLGDRLKALIERALVN